MHKTRIQFSKFVKMTSSLSTNWGSTIQELKKQGERNKKKTFLPSSNRGLDTVTQIVLPIFVSLHFIPTKLCTFIKQVYLVTQSSSCIIIISTANLLHLDSQKKWQKRRKSELTGSLQLWQRFLSNSAHLTIAYTQSTSSNPLKTKSSE